MQIDVAAAREGAESARDCMDRVSIEAQANARMHRIDV
jgi:hypothetical protein